MLTTLLVIAILVFLIVIHELGHFIAAKIFGVRVDEFGIGYPPRALLFGKIGETAYTLNWIPFGGFVRLFGEESEHGRGSLLDSARWKQAIILVAGVFMNAVAAWVLFTGAYTIGILHPVDVPTPGARLIVSDIVSGSPADAAGLKVADTIVDVRDAQGVVLASLTPGTVQDFVSARGGQNISITFVHAAATSTAVVRPANAVIADEAGRPAVGVGLVLVTTEAVPLREAMVEAYYTSKGAFVLVGGGLWTILNGALHGAPDLENIVGPVGIVGVVGEASQEGLGYVLSLAAFISVNLAIVNLIPIPALDGGRLLVVGIESVWRRPAPKLALQILNTIGIALIIMLMLIVTYHDIVRQLA